MIRINQIKMNINHTEEELKQKIQKLLRTKNVTYQIRKQSIDARKGELHYIYAVDVKVDNETAILNKVNDKNIMLTNRAQYTYQPTGTQELKHRPVVVGSGPGGLFCAYMLAKEGYKPIVLERGECVEDRMKSVEGFWKTGVLNKESNVQFGEGGAGTFSDGKINTLVKDSMGRNDFVLEAFVKFGADEKITYVNKPHIGTDVLQDVVRNIRNFIIEQGGEFRFSNKMQNIIMNNGKLEALEVLNLKTMENYRLDTEVCVLAIGHSARDTFHMLHDLHMNMEQKPFAVGVRVEHPQNWIDTSQYGRTVPKLGAAAYKLTAKAKNGRGVYSFCMCPGGYVVNASSEEGRIAVNGMSYSKRDGENANAAIVVQVGPEDYPSSSPLAAIEFQRNLEEAAYKEGKGAVPVQLYGDFKEQRISKEYRTVTPNIKGSIAMGNLCNVLPKPVCEAIVDGMEEFGKKIKGFNHPDTVLSAVESRTSSPVRLNRDETFQSNLSGIYPCGEGAGYAGGIMSAAMDGMKVYEAISAKYKNVR